MWVRKCRLLTVSTFFHSHFFYEKTVAELKSKFGAKKKKKKAVDEE